MTEYTARYFCMDEHIYECTVQAATSLDAIDKADRMFDVYRRDPNVRCEALYDAMFGEPIDVHVSVRHQT